MVSISVPCIGEGRFQISVGLNPVLWENSPKIGQAAGASAAAFLHAGCTLGQLSHDLAPLLGAQLRPAANLLNRAVTADANSLARVNGAQLYAGAVNLISEQVLSVNTAVAVASDVESKNTGLVSYMLQQASVADNVEP